MSTAAGASDGPDPCWAASLALKLEEPRRLLVHEGSQGRGKQRIRARAALPSRNFHALEMVSAKAMPGGALKAEIVAQAGSPAGLKMQGAALKKGFSPPQGNGWNGSKGLETHRSRQSSMTSVVNTGRTRSRSSSKPIGWCVVRNQKGSLQPLLWSPCCRLEDVTVAGMVEEFSQALIELSAHESLSEEGVGEFEARSNGSLKPCFRFGKALPARRKVCPTPRSRFHVQRQATVQGWALRCRRQSTPSDGVIEYFQKNRGPSLENKSMRLQTIG